MEHAPVFTVAEARELRTPTPGGNCKCLFLGNKAGQMWLLVLPDDLRLDMQLAAAALGSARLSFCSPERLRDTLGVDPGAVTPFAAINDRDGRVSVVLAQELLAHDDLNFHPLVNDRTTTVAADDLLRFLEATGHSPIVLNAADVRAH